MPTIAVLEGAYDESIIVGNVRVTNRRGNIKRSGITAYKRGENPDSRLIIRRTEGLTLKQIRAANRAKRGLQGEYDDLVLGEIEYDEFLGKKKRSTWSKIKKVGRKSIKAVGMPARVIARPIAKVTAPVTRPMDRILKRTPLVRTAYRAGIATTYTATGQFNKVPKAFVRTAKSAVKDIGSMKNAIQLMSNNTVGRLAKQHGSKISKNALKALAIPVVSKLAMAKFGPVAVPFVAVAVNTSINKAYAGLKSFAKTIPTKPYEAQKMPEIPSVPATPEFENPYAPQQEQAAEPAKSGLSPALLAIPALFFLMG